MPLFGKSKSSKIDKNLASFNQEERLEQEALQKIMKEKEQIFKHHKALQEAREKAEGRKNINKQAKAERWYKRKHTDGSRAHFGMHQMNSSSEIYQITQAIDINQRKIKDFIKNNDLTNLPAEPSLKSISLALKNHNDNKALIEQYTVLNQKKIMLEKQREKAVEYQKLNTEWQHWKDSDDMPSASVKERILDIIKKDALPKGLSKIPIIGPFIGMGLLTYKRLQLSISEVRHETRNILAGTRKRTAAGRIIGMLTGSVVGGVAMGGALALAGSFIPVVGSAIGGIAGVILGSTLGAAAGGPVGVKMFDTLSSFSKRLKNEQDYEMPYTQLKNLRTFYGLGEDQVLKMNAYLNNQIKIEGPKSSNGKALLALRKAALEKGRQNALAKLCFYFITQEKALRAELHNTGIEFLNNQQEKVHLLRQRRDLEKSQPSDVDIATYEQSLINYPFIQALYQIKKENHITKSYSELVSEFSNTYPTEGSDEQKQNYVKNLQLTLNISKSKAEHFIALMLKNGMNIPEERNKFINEHTRHNNEPPYEKWVNQCHENDKQLKSNQVAAQDILHRRFQLSRDRDGVVDILKEFKSPSELNNPDQLWIYGEMKKHPEFGDPIEALFERRFDEKTKQTFADLSKPKDFRSLGKDSAVLQQKAKEANKAQFREDMRGNAYQEAIDEISRHPSSFWKLDFSEAMKTTPINLVQNKAYITTMTQSLDEISQQTRELINHIQNNTQSPEEINNNCKKVIFDLIKLEQNFPELKDFITPKTRALQDIQFYLEYAAINNVYARNYLNLPHDSPLHDLFPYTEKGFVKHVKEKDVLVENNIENVPNKMDIAEQSATRLQAKIKNELHAVDTTNQRITQYNQSNPDQIAPIQNEIFNLTHAEIQQLRSADASTKVNKKPIFSRIFSPVNKQEKDASTQGAQADSPKETILTPITDVSPVKKTTNKKNK